MTGYHPLEYSDLAWASSFLVLNAVLSVLLGLGIARSLVVSALRMTVQLLLVGIALKWIFAQSSLWLTLAVALLMTLLAAREVWARQSRRLSGPWGTGWARPTSCLPAVSSWRLRLRPKSSPTRGTRRAFCCRCSA
ncbi:ABC transporter permease [Breoghania sp. L-A4]|uniref:ABC transporter permease n=1 Tax=Breoghania sp. L-A4 TaxID=2304600 RepID=UPI003204D8AA